jgi:hypothetical protein
MDKKKATSVFQIRVTEPDGEVHAPNILAAPTTQLGMAGAYDVRLSIEATLDGKNLREIGGQLIEAGDALQRWAREQEAKAKARKAQEASTEVVLGAAARGWFPDLFDDEEK